MRTEIRPTPDEAPDDSEHVLRWMERGGQPREERVAGEAAAVALWNALHEATVDPERRVNDMTWSELVRVEDGKGREVGVEERPRASHAHRFAALGVYGAAE